MKSRKSIQKSMAALLLVGSLILAIGLAGCGDDDNDPSAYSEQSIEKAEASSPEEVARTVLAAFEEKNMSTILDSLVLEEAETERQDITSLFEMVETYEVANLNITTLEQSETEATLEVEFDQTVTLTDGNVVTEHNKDVVPFIKVDGKWLVADMPIGDEPTTTSVADSASSPTMPPELFGVWKSDCEVHPGYPFGTIVWTIEDSMLRMVYNVWNDSNCIDSSKKFEDFVVTWEPNLIVQNTDGSYTVTATLIAETAAYLTVDGVALANDQGFYEYNDWQVGISKDVSGKVREPGASPELTKGTQFDWVLKVDGDKLSLNLPGLSEVIYTKQ